MYRISLCSSGVCLKLAVQGTGGTGLLRVAGWVLAAVLLVPSAGSADDAAGGVTFHDIAAGGQAGLVYDRGPSVREQTLLSLQASAPVTFPFGFLATPIKPRGAPGVVVFDFDDDGDEDLYVTNGPGRDNSLFSSQLRETGAPVFVDVAVAAGVGSFDQDSAGAAAADLDNDGDQDLVVLGAPGPNKIFENNGDGTFTDVTPGSGLADGPERTSQSVCLGDLNGDGLVDIFVANGTDFNSNLAIFDPFYPGNQHNQLFFNRGDLTFEDVSDTAGVTTQAGFPPGLEHAPSFTHVCGLVDYDRDGDLDLFTGGDQGAIPSAGLGGVDNGLIHLFENDGTGQLTDINVQVGLNKVGGWMGFAFGDFDRNGHLDFFGTNFGTYQAQFGGIPRVPGEMDSRWFLQQPDGTFTDPGVGALVASPFGWGSSPFDYDNDGDTDIVFHGGLDAGVITLADNPGVILVNDGTGAFAYDSTALARSTDHSRRAVHGVAVGDLDGNGFTDIVSVSNHDYPEPLPLALQGPLGSPFDATAYLWPTWVPTEDPDQFIPNPALPPLPNGSLSVELNGGNGNPSLAVEVLGTRGLATGARVNRDGVGAVVTFHPAGGSPVMMPVVAGSSYASQDSLVARFGLGEATGGTVEVLWPGGTHNRLYDVGAGERILFPEIPCGYGQPMPPGQYLTCVAQSVLELGAGGVLTLEEQVRFFDSAVRARVETGLAP